MAIRCTCRCGAHFRLPTTAIGRKARCRACGVVFTVKPDQPEPADAPIPLEGSEPAEETGPCASDTDADEFGSWLEDFALSESAAPPDRRASGHRPGSAEPARSEPLAASPPHEAKDILAPPVERPSLPDSDDNPTMVEDERDWVTGPQQPFWQDLAESFVFFLDANSFLTLVFLTIIHMAGIVLPFVIPVALIGSSLIACYLCAVALSIVVTTASGEDNLPNLWINDIFDDLLFPLFRVIGTCAFCLIPVGVVKFIAWEQGSEVPEGIVIGLVVFGAFFWPIVVLGVAIGRSFQGLWPHTVIRTFLAAPMAYLAVWAALLAAVAINFVPSSAPFQSMTSKLGTRIVFPMFVLSSGLSVYAMIVSMRVIGLYYRHYKQRFPWIAE